MRYTSKNSSIGWKFFFFLAHWTDLRFFFHAALFLVSPTDTVPLKVSPPSYPSVTTPHTPLTSPPGTVYPAVLVGRTNSETKPKVPPPVPPRGTPKLRKGAQGFCHDHGFRIKMHAIENRLLLGMVNVDTATLHVLDDDSKHRRSLSDGGVRRFVNYF